MVARIVRDDEVGGSNPLAPTKLSNFACVAIDAKYKRIDPEADVYQALAYAKALNLRRVALVYPADGEVIPTTHEIRNDDVTVLVRVVPVGTDAAGFAGLDQRAARAARDLLSELVGDRATVEAA